MSVPTVYRERIWKDEYQRLSKEKEGRTLMAAKGVEEWANFPYRTQKSTGMGTTGQGAAGLNWSLQFSTPTQFPSSLLTSLLPPDSEVSRGGVPSEARELRESVCVEQWNLHFFSTAQTQNTNIQNKIPREEIGGCYPRENTCKQWYLQGLSKNNNWSPDLPQWRPPVYKTNTCMLSFWSGELFGALLLRVNTQGPRDTLI